MWAITKLENNKPSDHKRIIQTLFNKFNVVVFMSEGFTYINHPTNYDEIFKDFLDILNRLGYDDDIAFIECEAPNIEKLIKCSWFLDSYCKITG